MCTAVAVGVEGRGTQDHDASPASNVPPLLPAACIASRPAAQQDDKQRMHRSRDEEQRGQQDVDAAGEREKGGVSLYTIIGARVRCCGNFQYDGQG